MWAPGTLFTKPACWRVTLISVTLYRLKGNSPKIFQMKWNVYSLERVPKRIKIRSSQIGGDTVTTKVHVLHISFHFTLFYDDRKIIPSCLAFEKPWCRRSKDQRNYDVMRSTCNVCENEANTASLPKLMGLSWSKLHTIKKDPLQLQRHKKNFQGYRNSSWMSRGTYESTVKSDFNLIQSRLRRTTAWAGWYDQKQRQSRSVVGLPHLDYSNHRIWQWQTMPIIDDWFWAKGVFSSLVGWLSG